MEKDLKEHVAQFLAQLASVAGVERVERLVRLFQQVATEAFVRLFAGPRDSHRVPAAAARSRATHQRSARRFQPFWSRSESLTGPPQESWPVRS